MALSLSAQSLLGRISSGHLECSICVSRYKQPKVLDCLHSFCLKCLIQLRQRNEPASSTLVCPVCRRETTLKDVADLPNNFTISALVEEVAMQEKLLEGQGSEIKCQSCEEENAAVSRCIDCDQFLCQECQRAHERLAMMKSHKVYTLAQLRSGEIAFRSKLRDVPKCGKHTEQNVCFYCNTCERLVCTTCCILDHTQPEHSLIGLPEALDKCKHDIAKVSAKAEQSKTDLCIAMEEIDTSIKKLNTNFDETGKKISKKADEEVAKIREKEKILKQELKEVYEDRLKTFETAQSSNNEDVTQAEQKLDEVNQLMAQASCYEIINLRLKLLRNLQELTGTQPEKVSNSLSFLNFEEAEESLGTLTLEEPKLGLQPNVSEPVKPEKLGPVEKWDCKTQIKTFGPEQTAFGQACDVAVFSDNETIVADTRNRYLVTFMHPGKLQSTAEPQVLQISGLTDPSRIAVNKSDQLVVLDGHVVKIFSREYKLLHQFIPGRGFGPGSKPSCLAVDENNMIAVGYKYKEEISLHRPDGSVIRTLTAPMIGDYLTASRRHLIYTNWDKNKLHSVGYVDGRVIFSVGISSYLHETGVCCNGEGDIYVALSGDWSTGEIHRFDPDGKYIGCVIEACGTPYGITLTPDDGDLVVAAGYSVKVFGNAQGQICK